MGGAAACANGGEWSGRATPAVKSAVPLVFCGGAIAGATADAHATLDGMDHSACRVKHQDDLTQLNLAP